MKQNYDIVVVGAGITGLTVAAMLAKGAQADRWNITLVDAAARPVVDSSDELALRVSAISIGSADLLNCIGAWSIVESGRICPYDRMRVWDESDDPNGPSTLRFDADEFAIPHLGYIVENIRLRHALLEVLDETEVALTFSSPLKALQSHGRGHQITLHDGKTLEADLVIAADGARSFVRNSAGIDVATRPYEQTAFVTHLRPDKPHAATAWQRFLRDGPLGILPLDDGRVSVVWSTTPEKAERALKCSDKDLGHLLSDASDAVLGRLLVAGPRGAYPLAAQHAERYVAHGIALIGDAAHTVHPLAGQGANLGLADARALADVIQAALENGEYPADRPVLRRYERMRKGENATMMHFITGLNRLFASDSVVLGELRRAGMALFNRSGPIRQHVVDVALGGGRR
ncbi:MAG: UbiH/UbiF/VisC/COQ6 family ubiquinone biosynthesis hydroxylase [Gammaproteobacteria bacterium]|nr:UbiH/UbiF/VisC/COQ6 family ubiquinone biosynthesis hydroxylase [Gammaproteobacteria bacterium]